VAPAAVGNSDDIEVGDQVFVIGAPYGISHSLTVGHVSARRVSDRLFGGFRSVELLQTDAVINQGNSGGPLFSMRGEVVGVVSHILSASGGYQGLGFAVTSNLAMHALLDEPGMWTGLDGVLIADDVARALNLPQRAGILIQAVAAGSPAAAFGLRPGTLPATIAGQSLVIGGDIILAVHGIRIGETDFWTRIREQTAELTDVDSIRLEILRGGEVIELARTVSSLRQR
jgi:S1-C subfamily serine protease